MSKDQPIYRPLDFEQVARYLSNEMSTEEAQAFEQQVAASEEWTLEFERIKKTWNASVVKTEINTQLAWQKLDARIKAAESETSNLKLHSAKESTQKSSKTSTWILRVAASLVLLAAVTLGLRYFGQPEVMTFAVSQPGNFELPDGSQAKLNANSEIAFIDDFQGNQRTVSLKGEAFFKVTHNPEKPFVVETGLGSITVLGTEFNVNAVSDSLLEVTCQSGKVQVKGSNGEGMTVLTAGESATLSTKTGALIETKNTAGLYWLNKTLVFKNTDLKTVFKTLSRTFGVKIRVENKSINKCRQTATFSEMEIDQILELIQETHNLTLTKKGTDYEVDGDGC